MLGGSAHAASEQVQDTDTSRLYSTAGKVSRGKLRSERRTAFQRQWEAHGLHTEMPAASLAERVFRIRASEVDAQPMTAQFAAQKVESKGDKNYEAQYLIHLRRLSVIRQKILKNLSNDARFARLSLREQTQIALDESVKRLAAGQRHRDAISRNDPQAPVATRKTGTRTIRWIGSLAQDHLKAKGLDFDSLSFYDIEVETRTLDVPEMSSREVSRFLNRFIQHRRAADEVSMARIKIARRKYTDTEWHRKQEQSANKAG